MLIEGNTKEFQRNAVEYFFLVVIDDDQYAVDRLVNILKSQDDGKRGIIKRFSFARRFDIMRKDVNLFEICRQVLTNIDSEECLNIVHDRYWASINGGYLQYEDDSEFFGWAWDDAVDKRKSIIYCPRTFYWNGMWVSTLRVKFSWRDEPGMALITGSIYGIEFVVVVGDIGDQEHCRSV